MIVRRLVLVLVIVGAFWYLTSRHAGPLREVTLAGNDSSPLTLTEAHAAPEFDAEETNNISVYKKALPSVVNITSTRCGSTSSMGRCLRPGKGRGLS